MNHLSDRTSLVSQVSTSVGRMPTVAAERPSYGTESSAHGLNNSENQQIIIIIVILLLFIIISVMIIIIIIIVIINIIIIRAGND